MRFNLNKSFVVLQIDNVNNIVIINEYNKHNYITFEIC